MNCVRKMPYDKFVFLGTALVLIGIILIFFGSAFAAFKGSKTSVKSAGVVFIGPIPFGWASDKQMFYILLALAVVFLLVWLAFFRRS